MSSPEAPPPSEPTLEDLQYRVAELTEAVAARDAFIAIAAHELRNPMTPIIGQVELLLSGIRTGKYTPAQIEQRLGRVRQAMSHYSSERRFCWTCRGSPPASSRSRPRLSISPTW